MHFIRYKTMKKKKVSLDYLMSIQVFLHVQQDNTLDTHIFRQLLCFRQFHFLNHSTPFSLIRIIFFFFFAMQHPTFNFLTFLYALYIYIEISNIALFAFVIFLSVSIVPLFLIALLIQIRKQKQCVLKAQVLFSDFFFIVLFHYRSILNQTTEIATR